MFDCDPDFKKRYKKKTTFNVTTFVFRSIMIIHFHQKNDPAVLALLFRHRISKLNAFLEYKHRYCYGKDEFKYYRRCFERLGPSLVRVLRTWFNGYRNLKQSANPLLRAHSERLGRYVRESMPGIYPAILFGPNRVQREAARGLLRAVEKEFGPFSIRDKLLCWSTIPLSAWTWIADKLDIFLQPRLLRITHRL